MSHEMKMINLVTGKSGSGKSWKVIMSIMESLKSRRVITNVKMNIEHPNYIYKTEIEIKGYINQITKLFEFVHDLPKLVDELKDRDFFDCDFYIDECHLVGFRKRDEGLVNWLSVRRHLEQNIVLITQTLKKIHGDYVPDIHFHYAMIPQNKRVNKDMIGWYKYDEVGGDKIQTKYEKPNPQIFDIYETGKDENSTNYAVWKLIGVISALIGSLVAVYFLFMSGLNHTSGATKVIENKIPLTDANRSIEKSDIPDINFTAKKDYDYNNVECRLYIKKPTEFILLEKAGTNWYACTLINKRS